MNKIMLLGRLVKDVELRYTPTDEQKESVAIAKYTLAVNRQYKREGEQEADFIPVIVFGRMAEFAEKYFKKGQQVCVVGRLQIRHYDDENENRHYFTEVIAEEQHFADSKKEIS